MDDSSPSQLQRFDRLVRRGILAVAISASIAAAQPAEPAVGEVRFDGANRVTNAYLKSVIQTKSGDRFDRATVDADVVRLLRTGKFLSVTADTPREGDVVNVVFQVAERPTVTAVHFEGNRAITTKVLADKVPIKAGDPFDLFAVREGRDAILAAYREKGYGLVSVRVDEDAARSSGDVSYVIEEGPTVRIRKIEFEGNRAFDEAELKKHIRSKTYIWIFRTGAYDPDTAADDASTLQRYHRDRGFLDARVSYRVDPGEEPDDLRLVFTIVEGEPYVIESLRVLGHTVLTDAEISAMLKSRENEVVKQADIDADAKAIQTAYGERGYIYAAAQTVRVFSATPGFVILTFNITEGDPMTVGRIVVRGNANTQDKVIRRTLDLYPGDTFNLTKTKAAEDAVRATQLFQRGNVTPVGNDPGVRDVLFDVVEEENTNDLIFGFGVTSNSGLVGSVMLDIKNFDIFDTPRSWTEFFKMHAFRGAGQRLRIELQPGTELNRFRIDFTEPFLFDRPLRFDLGLYHFARSRESYDETRTGASASFGTRLTKGLGPWQTFKDWYGEIAFRGEYVDIEDADIFDHRSIREVEGGSILTSVKGTVVRDRTDSRFLPSRGDRTTLSYEQFLGDFNFGKIRANYARHFTLNVDEESRKTILSFFVNTGYIAGDAPVFEKFYAGGIGSIRGFDFRGVGPRGGLEDDPIGGSFLFTTTVEYTFPLIGELLRGVIFTDMGTVEEDFEVTDWRLAVGFGARLTIELFGPIPIELDLAAPLLRGSDDEEQVFSFFVGGSF